MKAAAALCLLIAGSLVLLAKQPPAPPEFESVPPSVIVAPVATGSVLPGSLPINKYGGFGTPLIQNPRSTWFGDQLP